MNCIICNVNKATIHFTELKNGVPDFKSYCAGCVKQVGLFNMSIPSDDVFKSLDNVAKSLDKIFKDLGVTPKQKEITCSDCGMTLSKFQQTGRFGCAKDYDLFQVGPMLEKIHGKSVHTGKAPEKPGDRIKLLKKNMEAAVKSEDYEKAAALRDEIKKLELK